MDYLANYDASLPEWTEFLERELPPSHQGAEVTLWVNSRYLVLERVLGSMENYEGDQMLRSVWLSIKSQDNSTRHSWRDFQRIKNELAGEEWEAIELYPPEKWRVDGANQYHLWCFPKSFLIESGLGFMERLVEGEPEWYEAIQSLKEKGALPC